MAKVNKPSPSAKPKAASKSFIPEQYQDVFYMAVLFISVFIFLGGAIFGNGFNATDTIASLSFKPYIEDASHSGHFPLWVPYIFCGMPSYASLLVTGDRWWDIVPKIVFGATNMIGKLMGNDIARVACFYGIYSIGMYLLMRSKKLNRFASFFGAFAAAYSTYVITWVMIGHNTKPVVLSLLPFAFLFTEKLREKFSLIYTLGLIVIIHLMLEASHLQMIFYSICAVGLYLVFELVSRLISKNNPMSVVKVAGILVVAGGISFLLSSDRYLAVQEYTSYSTRGSAPIS